MTGPAGHMGFIGVSTAQSSIMKVFPLWAEVLGLPTRSLVGHDVPSGAQPSAYVDLVNQIKKDPHHRGALVTTHKMKVYSAASHLFDEIDTFASACNEISSISKREGRLIGRAKDPLTVAMALDDFLPPHHFGTTGGEVLIFGAGGSGTALSWALAERQGDAPSRVTVTARSQHTLDELRRVHEIRGTPEGFLRYALIGSLEDSDSLLAGLPESSVAVNATGLGKDFPGSPLSDSALFPPHSYAWEFNYRGTLEFLHQAEKQEQARGLKVVDGWRYFIHGWSQVIADVFDVELTQAVIDELSDVAETVRVEHER
jgi:shikimate 5-dehydrogenase